MRHQKSTLSIYLWCKPQYVPNELCNGGSENDLICTRNVAKNKNLCDMNIYQYIPKEKPKTILANVIYSNNPSIICPSQACFRAQRYI